MFAMLPVYLSKKDAMTILVEKKENVLATRVESHLRFKNTTRYHIKLVTRPGTVL